MIQQVRLDETLPLAPAWSVSREYVLDRDPRQLADELGALAGDQPHYWVLEQGPLAPGSRRQSLLNLDSEVALAAALAQTFRRPDGPASLVFRRLPPQRAAGVLFTRHPLRPDLDHIVVEGRADGTVKQRLILHADGQLAWHSDEGEDGLLARVGTGPFFELARQLVAGAEGPRAGEWVWDGERLWLVQSLPIGSLPMPREVWTRRAGLGFSNQAITPLWYTMMGRWLKEGFWRPLGRRAGWDELGNVEPYRRQHSHLYGNGRFFLALQQWLGTSFLWWALPPAWRVSLPAGDESRQRASLWPLRARLAVLAWRLGRGGRPAPDAPAEDLWLELMRLDGLGEKLAGVEGWLGYVAAPDAMRRGTEPLPGLLLDAEVRTQLADLARVADGDLGWEAFVERHPGASAGADPAFPRFADNAHGRELEALREGLGSLPAARRQALRGLAEGGALPGGDPLVLRGQAARLRHRLAGQLRRVLAAMATRLVEQGILRHPDDIHFLYFDELWQAWQGQPRRGLEGLLGERKVRYLSDAHAGPPDWIIDAVGYGASPLGRQAGRETVQGFGLVPGQVSGRAQRVGSGWQLNEVQAGDILVLDQCDSGWLPWVALAGGLVLAHRDPLDPAAALARALGIPTVWGVDDAMHCLVDGETMELDGASGALRQHPGDQSR